MNAQTRRKPNLITLDPYLTLADHLLHLLVQQLHSALHHRLALLGFHGHHLVLALLLALLPLMFLLSILLLVSLDGTGLRFQPFWGQTVVQFLWFCRKQCVQIGTGTLLLLLLSVLLILSLTLLVLLPLLLIMPLMMLLPLKILPLMMLWPLLIVSPWPTTWPLSMICTSAAASLPHTLAWFVPLLERFAPSGLEFTNSARIVSSSFSSTPTSTRTFPWLTSGTSVTFWLVELLFEEPIVFGLIFVVEAFAASLPCTVTRTIDVWVGFHD